MRTRLFILLSLIVVMTLIVPGGTLPTIARSQPVALVAPTLSKAVQAPPTPYFSNVTDDVGLTGIPGFRISIADVNGDGYPDLLLHQELESVPSDCKTCKDQVLYLNEQGNDPNDPHSRKFRDYTEESGIRTSRRGTNDRRSNLAVFADVDNDGDLDMFSGIYGHRLDEYGDNGDRNDLYLNDGSGHFTLAPNSPFHQEEFWNTTSATFLDYDLDGNVDLFIGNWFAYMASFFKDQLYRGNGDGSFVNVTTSAGLDFALPGHQQPTYAVTTADTNNDGFMDLFAGNYCQGQSIHWQNNGDGTFTQVQGSTNYGQFVGPPFGAGWTCSWGSMPRDFDNDGDIDLFELLVHGRESTEHSTVLVNDNNVFEWDFNKINRPNDPDPTHHRDQYGGWFDIDNDGLADFVLSQTGSAESFQGRDDHLDLFKQSESHTFDLVTVESGLDSINTSGLPPHNATPFDYDLDGDEDLLIGFDGKEHGIQLWRNDVGTLNNWLTITLEGAGIPGHSNRSAIGARVEVTAGGKTYTREVYAGNGHQGPQVPLSLTFGLGQATKVDTIKVYWPNKNRTSVELNDIAVNQFIKIWEPILPTVKVAITRFIQIDDPDPFPFQGAGDYYSAVTINGALKHSSVVEATDFEPSDWVFTKVVDPTSGSVPVNIRIMDKDPDADDHIDINPTDGVTDLNLILDLNTGKWTGDVEFPISFSEGDGDTEHSIEGGERGKVFFDISVEFPIVTTLNVRAFIDGRSHLIVQRDTVHWHHLDYAAPGRLEGANEPTYLNDTAWFPTWPDVPDPENRGCDCDSSCFVGVPTLAVQAQTVALGIVQARGSVAIIQQPDHSNGFTLIVEFNDNGPLGADWYGINLAYLEKPAAIDLTSFTAEADADYVTLAWETGTEVDNAGFNLWRGEAADRPYTKHNDALIPAEGDPVSGASYVYTDADVVKGITYYYQLEDVDIYGVSTFHGPVSATPSPSHHIYLPLVLQ